RISDPGVVRNRFPIHLAVSARTLRTALHGMAGDGARRQLVPIVAGPAEFVQHRPEDQAGIGAAPGNHDLPAPAESIRDGRTTEIDVRALHARADSLERL